MNVFLIYKKYLSATYVCALYAKNLLLPVRGKADFIYPYIGIAAICGTIEFFSFGRIDFLAFVIIAEFAVYVFVGLTLFIACLFYP